MLGTTAQLASDFIIRVCRLEVTRGEADKLELGISWKELLLTCPVEADDDGGEVAVDIAPAPSERLFATPPEIPLTAGPQLLQGACVTQH